MSAKILITGATGSIGRVLVKNLIRRGKDVRAGVHTEDKFEYIKMTGVEPVRMEYGDFSTIDRALQGIKTLFLLTPFAREQVEFARRVIDRALLFGVDYIVNISMIGAQLEPGTQFTRWHSRVERYIESCGVAYTILRPNIYMQHFIRFVQPSGNFIYLPLNHARVSYIDVRDVAAVAAEVILAGKEHWGKIYELTGPDALTIDDVADSITSAIGIHIGYVNISEDTARHAMEVFGTPSWMAEGMLELYGLQRAGVNSAVNSNVKLLSGKPPIVFDSFAHDYANVFKAIIQQEHHTYLS